MKVSRLMDRTVAVAVLLSLGLAGTASAQTSGSQGSASSTTVTEDWKFGIAPYLWMVNVDGKLGLPRGPGQIPVDIEFSDLVDSINWGVAGVFVAEKGRYGGILEGNYVSLSGEGPLITETTNGINIDSTMFFSNALFTYRLETSGSAEVRIGGGARIWHVGVDAMFTLNEVPVRAESLSETWVDAVLGIRVLLPINNRWYGDLAGDVGAGQSDFTASAHAGIGFKITEKFHLYANYRYMVVDYSNDGFVYDITQQGALFGAIFVF